MPEIARRGEERGGSYHGVQEVARKTVVGSRPVQTSLAVDDSSPDFLLWRCSTIDDVQVALVHEGGKRPCQKVAHHDEEKKGIEGKARGCESSPENEEDGDGSADSGEQMRRPWGVLGAHEWGKRRRGSRGFYRTKEGRGHGFNRGIMAWDRRRFFPA